MLNCLPQRRPAPRRPLRPRRKPGARRLRRGNAENRNKEENKMNTWQEKFGLTPSEVEIASAVVKGYSNRKIAESFKISLHVVMYRLWKIADKLGVSTRS